MCVCSIRFVSVFKLIYCLNCKYCDTLSIYHSFLIVEIVHFYYHFFGSKILLYVWQTGYIQIRCCNLQCMANSVDPDQMLQNAASDLGLL